VKPSKILGLVVGDVLRIPHPQHRPLDVMVDGQPLARAAVGANGSRLACVVVTTEEKP
jgi:flagellar motor switch protein FliM